MERPERDASARPTDPTPEAAVPDEPAGRALEELAGHLGQLLRELLRLLDLRVEQARLGIRERLFRALLACWFAVTLAIATGLGLARALSGLSGLAASALGSEWAGDLVAGALMLAAIAATVLGLRGAMRRRGLKRLRAKFEKPATEEGS